ncbi:FtsQ-type POTRA domain-containing protein [Paenibacillus sp. JMULE4]|uniref:cell division protein FtsQ/DivIB n=1 Tax=Paenibacillus TaxID=44249 RepID=UPI0015762C5A|nr:FtsQ-type POTRA domain-containing protein [Paenibacillus sp. JMULE4]NTZ18465.1 FtsQ-type POTRA domain-containing protein [Paenibacillus sp. JMULE4]
MTSEDRLPVIKKPAPRNRSSKRLLLFLFVFFITLLLVLFFQSSLSQITEIEVQGQELVSAEDVKAAAAVKPGDHFFSVSSSGIAEKVKALRMIESVQVSKHFPGRILIEIKEYPKVAYQIGEDGRIEALLADASVVPVTLQGFVPDKPLLTGWGKDDPLKTQLCLAMSKLSAAYFADVSEIKPDPSSSYPDKIKMYTRSQFEVQTTIGYLPEKIIHLNTYIANLKENNQSGGVLRLLEADSHTPLPFEQGRKEGDANTSAPSQ